MLEVAGLFLDHFRVHLEGLGEQQLGEAVTADDILERQRQHCEDSAFAVAMVTP